VLERQRQQEYLYLAGAEGQIERYVVMLARMGRTQEAVEGIQYLNTPRSARGRQGVARSRRARGLRVASMARRSSRLPPITLSLLRRSGKANLASWTADPAAGMGQ
jgi:hypothetical protein